MKKLFLFFIGMLVGLYSQSQISQIIDSSLYGGRIESHAINSSCVLVATNGGIFKTTDHGQNWSNVTQNFDPHTVSCNKIVSIGNNFYALSYNSNAPYVYKSSDDGTNWSPTTSSSQWPSSLGMISNTLYIVNGDMNGGYLYSSSDGSSWTQKAKLWNSNWQGGNNELYSFNQNKLYIILRDSLYYTTDGNTIDTVTYNGLGITSFSNSDHGIGGDASGNLYFETNGILYQYDFTGKTWNDISTGKIQSGYQIMNYSVTDNAVFIIAMNSSIGIKIYKSSDHGNTFTELTTNLAVPIVQNIIEVATNTFIGNGVYDNIYYSTDGGNNWTAGTTNQYIATYAGNLAKSGNALLISRQPKGIIRSTNQGTSWSSGNTGIPGFGGIAYFVNELIAVKDTLFSFCQQNPFSNDVTLYKSSNNGISWVSCPIPAPYNTGSDYSFAGKCDSALFVRYYDSTASKYSFIVSFNYGSTWIKPNSQSDSEKVYLKGPLNCLFVSFATNSWDDFSNIYKATNFGTSFTDLNTGNLFNNGFQIKRLYSDENDKGEAMMDFDASNNLAVFVVVDRTQGIGINKLEQYNVTNGNWSEISTSGLPTNYVANYIKNVGSNSWLLATNSGVYLSTNGGSSWSITYSTGNWQNGMIVNSIKLIGNTVFLGTLDDGVWKIENPFGVPEQASDNSLLAFPNPTADIINITVPDFNGTDANVSVYNAEGKIVMNKTIDDSQFQLNLSGLSSGNYIIELTANHRTYKMKIIRK